MSLMGGPPSPSRPFATWVDQAERLFHTMEDAGFTFAVFSHAYQASLAGGMQPTPLIARLAPVSGNMRLAVQVLLLPLLNPMDVAYNVASLDQITEGRLDLGIGLGYHPMELEPSGIPRSQRAGRFEESVEVLRKFWSNAPVEHKGPLLQRIGYPSLAAPRPDPSPAPLGLLPQPRSRRPRRTYPRRHGRRSPSAVRRPHNAGVHLPPVLGRDPR